MAHRKFALRSLPSANRSTRRESGRSGEHPVGAPRADPNQRPRDHRVSGLLLVVLLTLTSLVAAQPAATPSSAYVEAQSALSAALASGQDPHPDQPAWEAAYLAADTAVATARDAGAVDAHLEALSLAGRVYAYIGWYSRAFAAYDSYFADGGELLDARAASPAVADALPSDHTAFVTSANQLAFARYQAGDMEGATAYYLSVLDIDGDEPEALRWLGRIAFERGDVQGAQVAAGYFERLLELDLQDASAAYFLDLSHERVAVGVRASDEFRAGIASYEAGDLPSALEHFEAAAEEAPDFTDAAVWAGRTALELDLPELAVRHWQRVVEARPDDEGAAWFLGLAQTQLRWGSDAGRAYYDGLAAYEEGDLEAAVDLFDSATQSNPEFVDAWVWAARSLQESDRPLESIPYWERVLELDPQDERARWYLTRAGTAQDHGAVAGPAYYDAAARYQAGDVAGALELLEVALDAEPEFAQAWGLLGRIRFQQQRYDLAAEAYGAAAELEPNNDDYAFFANEARVLSQPEEGP